MPSLIKQKICATALSALIALTIIGSGAFFIFLSEKYHQREELGHAKVFVSAVIEDVSRTLKTLNAVSRDRCDSHLLSDMEKQLFHAKYLKEIGFVLNGNLICTTSSGVLPIPLSTPEPTFTSARGSNVTLNHPSKMFEGERIEGSGIIVEAGYFNVVVHESYLDFIDITLPNWQVIFKDETRSHHVYGAQNVYDASLANQKVWAISIDQGLYSHVCELALGYCVAAETPYTYLVEKNVVEICLLVMLAIISFCLVFQRLFPFSHVILSTEYRVKNGLETRSYFTVYQPIVHLETETIVGIEALGRYKDRFGHVCPDTFLPLLKHHKQTWRYTVNQIEVALRDISSLDLPKSFKVGFNLFPEDLTQENVCDLIEIAAPYLTRFKIDFEIVEDRILDQIQTKKLLVKLLGEGFTVSIDDFGTGYANLGQLESIPCDYLKIDRKFIANIGKDSLLPSLVPQISNIAKEFGLSCVAEGIESTRQKEFLTEIGVEYGQGLYLGEPMALEQLMATVDAKSRSIDLRVHRLNEVSSATAA